MLTFSDLLGQTVAMLEADGTDPDGPVPRRGLLLAAHAGLTVDRDSPVADGWDLYTVAIDEAITALHADLPHDMVLDADIPDAGRDDPGLRELIRTLVGRLADQYAAAAAGVDGRAGPEDSRPWRRQVWANVAHRLDHAVSQLV
ncbi:MAG: hypothetical protein HKP61_06795 [Dactylosporangium sp.]|nr:hypothetical protein [Dactylosporangium sp.]NNJ60652.1 hypothetical protein [Dactylosporangium sp.]